MSDPIKLALIQATLVLLTALVSAAVAIITFQMRTTITKLERNTNSIKDDLVELTGRSAHAKGKLEGREEMRREQKAQLEEAGRIDLDKP